MISVDGRSFGRGEYFSDRNRRSDQYSYGWSFILATLGFLGSELSALLCLAAFLNRFDSEVRICKCNMNTVEKWNCLKFFKVFRAVRYDIFIQSPNLLLKKKILFFSLLYEVFLNFYGKYHYHNVKDSSKEFSENHIFL